MCAMILCMSLLAGCSLVEINYKDYYSQVVAVVEKGDNRYEITKRDLLYAYQTTGYQYVQYYGKTKQEAYKQVLTSLENNKILVATAETELGLSRDGTGLTDKEKTYLYTEVENSLHDNLKSFYDQIVKDEASSSSTEESDSVTFKGYTKNAKYEDGKIVKQNNSQKLLSSFPYSEAGKKDIKNDKELLYKNFVESLIGENYKKAYANYYRNLKANEYGMGLSTAQKEVYMREIDRLYNSVYENYVVEKYHESITDEENTNVTTEKIANLYTHKVRAGYSQYVIAQDSSYDSDLSGSLDSMYYFKEGADDNKYFTVANILIKFDDEQQKEYNDFTAKNEKEKYDGYQSDIDGVYNKLQPLIRIKNSSTGEYEGEKRDDYTVEEVYTDICSRLSVAQSTGLVNRVGDEINELIYEYNEDPGMLNATNNYVIGVDKDGKLVSNSFVSSFNDGAIKLYNNGNAKIGDVSGYVYTSYGIHILIYTGACQNLFDGVDSSFVLSEDGLQVLANTRVNPLVDKTYFDVLYDEIYADHTTSFQNANLSKLKQDFEIYEYTSRFSDLF